MLLTEYLSELTKTIDEYSKTGLIVSLEGLNASFDIDIWIKPEVKNAGKVYEALKQYGAPLRDITVKDLTNRKFTISTLGKKEAASTYDFIALYLCIGISKLPQVTKVLVFGVH